MFKLAFILPNLLTGGSQRVFLNLIDEFYRMGYNVTLIVVNKEENIYSGYEEDGVNNIERCEPYEYINLGCSRVIKGLLPLRRELLNNGYSHCISTLTYMNVIASVSLLYAKKRPKIYIRESNLISERFVRNYILKLAIRFTYNKAVGIICQSNAMLKDMANYTHAKARVIHNPVNGKALLKKSTTNWPINKNKLNIVMLGHMTYQKNYLLALSILELLDDDSILHIIGRKLELHEFLVQLAKRGLENRVKLYGFQENPHEIMSRCDIFLMTSKYEGLPNALLEAGVLGLPIVTTNFFEGLDDLLPSYGTTIVDSFSPKKIADAIIKVQKADLIRSNISSVYKKKFSAQNILREYLEFFECESL
jgi:glycosyltransferase involved in cell wall biosynthesis